ncbi:LOW QUALITY PROTEIN: uncharacterized protein LOC143372392 [Andrena cerasifolii]|uniref:LOW QUALITY PROTEIN: uncharacterized protein LOC143372392 n=1 Tax=Andrena cerasifolii TaxID=2819439 RepID=UPI00403778FB
MLYEKYSEFRSNVERLNDFVIDTFHIPVHNKEKVERHLEAQFLSPYKKRSGNRSKRRKIAELEGITSTAELTYATTISLRKDGKVAAAEIVKEITTTTPTRGQTVLKKWRERSPNRSSMPAEEAFGMIMFEGLSRATYRNLRKRALKHGHNLYPSEYALSKVRKETYPEDGIHINEEVCEITLQSLLNHTAKRIILSKDYKGNTSCTLTVKYGFDGSSGHSGWKQKGLSEEETDEYIFQYSMVPLELKEDTSEDVIWKNPRPSSTRFCRPIRLQWKHETNEVIIAEKMNVEEQIARVTPFKVGDVLINYKLHLTMVDGKVCSAMTDTSTQKCYLCNATPKTMNKLGEHNSEICEQYLQFGLSNLHCYIRFLECILHISYRLCFCSWAATKKVGTVLLAKRQKMVQEKFWTHMGLKVDRVKQSHGNTNDGNTARRIFNNPHLTAEITGVNEECITRFSTILKAINSSYSINKILFHDYCRETAELYVKHYSWYYMPVSVHKILIHGSQIVENFTPPIGSFSEEALECRNKNIRQYREDHTQKRSLLQANKDLFHRLLELSDPYLVTKYGIPPKKKKENIPEEVGKLLVIVEETDTELEEVTDMDLQEEDVSFFM